MHSLISRIGKIINFEKVKSGEDRAKIALYSGHRLISCRWINTSTDSWTSLLTRILLVFPKESPGHRLITLGDLQLH